MDLAQISESEATAAPHKMRLGRLCPRVAKRADHEVR